MRVALYGKTITREKAAFLQTLTDKLEHDKIALCFHRAFWERIRSFLKVSDRVTLFDKYEDLLEQDVKVLFSVGGDGTMLETITLLRDSGIPVMGINLGRLGFLSSVPTSKALDALDEVMKHRYTIEERTLLKVEADDYLFGTVNYALNELTVHKSEAHSMLAVKVTVDGNYLNTYWADGLLIATPTGSTAYSMSCGGPIVTPNASNFIITPIASHNLTVRPVVIPDDSVITVEVLGRSHKYNLGLDSRYIAMEKPVALTIKKEKFKVNFIRLEDEGFFDTIRKKLNWGLDNRN
jgi:NAD+ kinase